MRLLLIVFLLFVFTIRASLGSRLLVELILCAVSALVLYSLGLWCMIVFGLQMYVPLSISGVYTAEFLQHLSSLGRIYLVSRVCKTLVLRKGWF